MRGSHFSGDFLTQEIPDDFFSCSQTRSAMAEATMEATACAERELWMM